MSKRRPKFIRPKRSSKRILLVEPDFPIPTKSKNHKNFLPIGLLKLGAWLMDMGYEVKLIQGNVDPEILNFEPHEIWITSLFTYWSKYVIETSKHYKAFPNKPRIVIGGIYASLMSDHCRKSTGADAVFKGVHSQAEKYYPAYDLLENGVDYQIVHATRGCVHKCRFCGVHIIEPNGLHSEESVIPLITKPINGRGKASLNEFDSNELYIEKRNLVFYDNNFLAHSQIELTLEELISLRKQRKIGWCESQSGFDGRIMKSKPHLARMLKEAGFRAPRIAWDWGVKQGKSIKEQIDLLVEAGYASKDIYVFMIYNWGITFEEMEQKRIKCFDWQVQIADCRYRPLNQTFDEYKPRKRNQTDGYHIHARKGWTDDLVKQFRRNVRRQNICIRHGYPLYCKEFERKKAKNHEVQRVKRAKTLNEKVMVLEDLGYYYWDPREVTYPKDP
ncbi:MAG: Fe-S oxidoreductase [Candidatus Thorarchaeota archaeon]